jgi:multidrug efflux pump
LNDFLASQIVVDPDSDNGHTSGEIMEIIEDVVPKVLGNRYDVKWFGLAYQQQIAGNQSAIALSLGLIMVFLILAALFEMWSASDRHRHGAAVRPVRRGFRPADIPEAERSLLPGQSADTDRSLGQERHPDSGICHRWCEEGRHVLPRRGDSCRPAALPAHRHDLDRLHSGGGAPGHGQRRRRHAQNSVGPGIVGGMLGSTCVAVLFVPMFFTVMMGFSSNKGDGQEPAAETQ